MASAAANVPAAAHGTRVRQAGTGSAVSAAPPGVPLNTASMATLASPMSRSRFFTLRSRQRRRRSRIAGGVSRGSLSKSIGPRSTSASVCEIVSPSNRRWPVSISHSTTPNDQISARLSTALPAACSGLMYAAVPMIMPACVGHRQGGRVAGFEPSDEPGATAASPKSSTLTTPSGVIMMLAGFRSR